MGRETAEKCHHPLCTAHFLDGHQLCCRHAPCTASEVFDQWLCGVCEPWLYVLLKNMEDLSLAKWHAMHTQWLAVQKWSLGVPQPKMVWADPELGVILGIATKPAATPVGTPLKVKRIKKVVDVHRSRKATSPPSTSNELPPTHDDPRWQ